MKSYDLIGTFLYDLLTPLWRLDLGVECHAYDVCFFFSENYTSCKFIWNCYFIWKIHFFIRLSWTRIIPGCSTDPGLYPYYFQDFHDLWLLSLSKEKVWRRYFHSSYASLQSPSKTPERDSLVGGKCNVWEQWDAPFLPKSAPSLAHSTGGPPRPPHWDPRTRSGNKDSAGGSSTENWLTVEWKRREFWLTEEGRQWEAT